MRESLIEMALDVKAKSPAQNKPLERYVKRFHDSEYLFKTYREQVQNKEYGKAL